MNQVLINGRVAQDPTSRVINDKMKVANFSVAVSTKSKDKDKSTIFVNCAAWNNTAEQVVQQFTKGSYIALMGHLTVENYTDKNGNKVSKTVIVADEVFNAKLLERTESKPQAQTQPEYNF